MKFNLWWFLLAYASHPQKPLPPRLPLISCSLTPVKDQPYSVPGNLWLLPSTWNPPTMLFGTYGPPSTWGSMFSTSENSLPALTQGSQWVVGRRCYLYLWGHLAMCRDVLGWHTEGCHWHQVGRGQGCHSAASAHDQRLKAAVSPHSSTRAHPCLVLFLQNTFKSRINQWTAKVQSKLQPVSVRSLSCSHLAYKHFRIYP